MYNITVLKRIEKKIHSNTRFTCFSKNCSPDIKFLIIFQ